MDDQTKRFLVRNYTYLFYIFCNNKKKTFFFLPSYIGGGVLVFFHVFLNKNSRCFILKIYHLRCSLIEQFILTAFIDLKVRNHCFGFR